MTYTEKYAKKIKAWLDKMKDKANRVIDKTLMATEEEDG